MASSSIGVTEISEGPATEIAAERLVSILQEAEVIREPVRRVDDLAEETGLTWELNTFGDWRRYRVEVERDTTITDRLKYKTVKKDLCRGTDRPVYVHRLWNGKVAPEHTSFGTPLKGKIGYARAGIEVAIPGFKNPDVTPKGTSVPALLDIRDDSLLGEVSQVKRAFGDMQMDFRKLRQLSEEQALEIKQLKSICEEGKNRSVSLAKNMSGVEEALIGQSTLTKVTETQLKGVSETLTVLVKTVESVVAQPAIVPQENFSQVMQALEGRLKTYTEVASEAQSVALQEREEERLARQARSLNIRISGLEELEGEVIKEVVAGFFEDTLRVSSPGFSEATSLGNKDLWEKADIVTLVETWDTSDNTVAEIDGFTRVASLWNPKRFSKGRGFGGLAVWVRNGINTIVTVEKADTRKQFLCCRIADNDTSVFLVLCYFAPMGSPVYSSNDTDPFLELSRTVIDLRDWGPVLVIGDFNSRTGTSQGLILPDPGGVIRQSSETEVWTRESAETGSNSMADSFYILLPPVVWLS
ncbi:hypothetical protein R1sor_018679 [Riccia sorocarpa]|uniref:Endonuclease/exonuclease/phosphatase domain-containing protein n=1 Tax=Riccia sorocarpa TaxID=122646 RepID=A0ABD3ID33_9MARC